MEEEKTNTIELTGSDLEGNLDQALEEASQEKEEPGVDALKASVEEFRDKYLRALAEMENMKKRQQRQYHDVLKYGKEAVLKDFLLVYDAIEKSIQSAAGLYPDDDHFISGLRMTEKLLLETLKNTGWNLYKQQTRPSTPTTTTR